MSYGRLGTACILALLLSGAIGCGSAGADDNDAAVDGEGGEGVGDVDGDRPDVRPDDGGRDEGGGEVPISCGDGILDPEEECDEGTGNSDTLPDACRMDCRRAHCGDAVVDTGEGCDDGNDVDTDACHNNCSLPTCGDGEMQTGEECDDGNDVNTDACLNTCMNATCGDGIIWVDHEECDGTASETCTTTCGSGGLRGCVDCVLSTDCVPPVEECNAADDDCDGRTDNGFDCARGAATACTTTCDSTGTGTCTADCTAPAAVDCTPPDEECNGEDDDCDGTTDNGFACTTGATVPCRTACDTPGSGACTAACEIPTGAGCTPPAETCNGTDDDCNSICDDGYTCCRGAAVSCTTRCDSTGNGVCTAACEVPTGDACTPPPEICNGEDDNCDLLTDEIFACVRGTPVACTTTCFSTGSGTCTDSCNIPTGTDCTPPVETCNGVDDNCDWVCDDGYDCCRDTVVPCTTTCLSAGTGVCTSSCGVPEGLACTPPGETCNAADDDCDLLTDEIFACVRGTTRPCTVGTCTGGSQLCSALCAWGACNFGAAPANDSCTSIAIPPTIPEANGSYSNAGSTCAAINDYFYACGAGAAAMGPDVVYRLVLTARKSVTLDTLGTSFDAILFLRSGSPCPGSAVTCDDNSAGGTPGQARITRTLDPGTYWIIVDGTTAGAYGTYVLNATIADPPVAPPNDACAGAIPLALGNTLRSVTGDTSLATDDNVSCSTGGGTSPDVWYTFTLPIPHAVYLSTLDTNTWDTVIHVHSGSCTGPVTAYGCADDANCATTAWTRSMFLGILPAGTYYVAIDGYGSTNSGPFTLFYQADTCVAAADASPITVAIDPILGDATYPGLTTGQGNDSTGTCAMGPPPQNAPDVYYYVGLCPGTTVTMSTCDRATNYDTVLYARRGTCRGGAGSGDLACNNDATGPVACAFFPPGSSASSISFGATGQGLYYAWVDGFVNPSGTPPSDGSYGLVVTGM